MEPVQSPPAAEAGPTATRREWIGLAVLALPCLLYSMDLTVLNLAVPQISADLRPSPGQLLWIVDIYGFMLAGFLITMGTLGDRIGRRRLLMIGAAAFGAASVLAAFSTSSEMLILARALLGLAAATLAPSTLSLIRNMFHDPRERSFAIGIWIASFSAGGAIGPIVGGILLHWFWWGSVFLIAVPVMVVLLFAAPRLLPEYREEGSGRLDLLSPALSLAAVLALIYGVKLLAERGWSAEVAAFAAAGLLLGLLFLRRQARLADPLVDLALFRIPSFSAALGINLFGFFVAFGSFLLIAQFLQLVLGLTPLEAGLWSLPSAAGFIIGSTSSPAIAARMRPGYLMSTGFAVAGLGFLLLAAAGGALSLGLTVFAFFVMSLGLAPVFTLATDLIIGAAPAERAGSAAGLAETSSELGGALGIAVLGSLATAVYAAGMQGLAADELGSALTHAARETVGAAILEADVLGGASGDALRGAARAAYAEAFQFAAMVCCGIALAGAVVTAAAQRTMAGRAPLAAPAGA